MYLSANISVIHLHVFVWTYTHVTHFADCGKLAPSFEYSLKEQDPFLVMKSNFYFHSRINIDFFSDY